MSLPNRPAGPAGPREPGSAADLRPDAAEPGTGRSLGLVAFLLVYALPLAACVIGLALVGLGQLAVALVVVEAGVLALVTVVRRRPGPPRTGPSRRPWLVPLALVGVLAAMLALTVVVAAAGRP